MRNLLADRPELAAQIPLIQVRMRTAILDALVTDYESLISAMPSRVLDCVPNLSHTPG